MALTETVSYSGQQNVSTFNGNISLETARGRLVVRDENSRELNVVDSDGYTFSDSDERRVRIGYNPQKTRVNAWISPDGKDVITLLESET